MMISSLFTEASKGQSFRRCVLGAISPGSHAYYHWLPLGSQVPIPRQQFRGIMAV